VNAFETEELIEKKVERIEVGDSKYLEAALVATTGKGVRASRVQGRQREMKTTPFRSFVTVLEPN